MPLPSVVPPSAEPQTLAEVLDWHRGVVEALTDRRATVENAIRTGLPVAPRFEGMTESDIESFHDTELRELDRLTVLNLVASAEATIKVDYFRRVREKLKDALSVAYQQWHKTLSAKKQVRPDFEDAGILGILKDAGVMDNHIVGRFRECLRARHWVGHGRYWAKPAEVDRLAPDDVYDRANTLLQALPS